MGDLNDVTFWQSERLENRSLLWLVPLPSRSKVMKESIKSILSLSLSFTHTQMLTTCFCKVLVGKFETKHSSHFSPSHILLILIRSSSFVDKWTACLFQLLFFSKNSTRMLRCWNGQLLRSKDWKIGEWGKDEFWNAWIWTLKIFGRWLIVNKNGIKRILSSSFFLLSWINDFQVFQSSSFFLPSSLWNPPPLHLTQSPFCFLSSLLSTAFSFYSSLLTLSLCSFSFYSSLLTLSLCSFPHDWNQLFFLEVNPIYSLITFVGRKRRAV